MATSTRDAKLKPRGYQKITVLTSSTALTVPNGAAYALIKVEGQTVRWRDDAQAPTTTDGMLIDVGDEFWYSGELKAIRFIETTASATLHVSYYS